MTGSLEEAIQKIIKLAKEQFILEDHNIHGFDHWNEVEQNGIMLANQPGVDLTVVRLFACTFFISIAYSSLYLIKLLCNRKQRKSIQMPRCILHKRMFIKQ